MPAEFAHAPVLLTQTIELLDPHDGDRYVDATVGAGGHAERILELSSPSGLLLGIDADPMALGASAERLGCFGDRVTLVEGYYDRLESVAAEAGFDRPDGILFDLGVSSPQIDRPERGFSFTAEGPLDMRMGPSAERSAADLVNELPEEELRRIFFEYGEERFSRRIARRIVEARRRHPIRTTRALAEIVGAAKPRASKERIHPATRIFQALRIAVNDELGRLSRALPQAVELLHDGGRLAVISFHSLEDRIVKDFMRSEARGCTCPPKAPVCVCGRKPRLRILTTRPVAAEAEEIERNPRARSAKLRVAERIGEVADDGNGRGNPSLAQRV